MTPARPDIDVVERRLRSLQGTLTDLGRLEGTGADELRADPITRAAAERLLQVAVDLAVDINAHLATSLLGQAPTTGRASFDAAASAGALSAPLAAELAPAAGLRNVLVHRYVDIDVELVARAVDELLELLPRYVREVATFLASLGDS